jgi:hypothetical protein
LALAIKASKFTAAGLDQHKFHGLFAFGAIGWWSIFAHKILSYQNLTVGKMKLSGQEKPQRLTPSSATQLFSD